MTPLTHLAKKNDQVDSEMKDMELSYMFKNKFIKTERRRVAKIPVLGLDIVGARLSLGWSEMGPFLSRVMLWEPSKFYIVWDIT